MSSDYPSIAEKNPGYSEQNRESERKKKIFFLPLPQSTTYDRGRGKQKTKTKTDRRQPRPPSRPFPSLPSPHATLFRGSRVPAPENTEKTENHGRRRGVVCHTRSAEWLVLWLVLWQTARIELGG